MRPVTYRTREEFGGLESLPPFRAIGQSDDPQEQASLAGSGVPPLIVRVERASAHFQDAFRAHADEWMHVMRAIAQEQVLREREWIALEERAIFGNF